MRAWHWWLLLAAWMIATPANAQPGTRVALVIGNAAYRQVPALDNPGNDARLVSEALGRAGFTSIDLRTDQTLADFRNAISGFAAKAEGAEAALVYYAGHGIEANGRNWLIPTDASLADAGDLARQAIDANLVVEALDKAKLKLLILDACRNNPFGAAWPEGVRAVSRGLGALEVDDVLVIFAAAPGQTAADGDAANSPFALALADYLAEPGLPVQFLGGMVRDSVLSATAEQQRPFISASITGRPYVFVPRRRLRPPPPGGAQSWVARQPALRMQEVRVARSVAGNQYRYRVEGIYPTRKPSGQPTPPATRIQVRTTDIADPQAKRRTYNIAGRWQPGERFSVEFSVPRTFLDDAARPILRLCMGDNSGCLASPDMARPPEQAQTALEGASRQISATGRRAHQSGPGLGDWQG